MPRPRASEHVMIHGTTGAMALPWKNRARDARVQDEIDLANLRRSHGETRSLDNGRSKHASPGVHISLRVSLTNVIWVDLLDVGFRVYRLVD